MHRPDFDDFRGLLNQLAATFGKPMPDDIQVQAYWSALKDQTLASVRRCAEHHTRYGKFFPKPVELRPKDDKPSGAPSNDAAFAAGVATAKERVREIERGGDHIELLRVEHARWSALQIKTPPHDAGHAEVMANWHRTGDELTRLTGVGR